MLNGHKAWNIQSVIFPLNCPGNKVLEAVYTTQLYAIQLCNFSCLDYICSWDTAIDVFIIAGYWVEELELWENKVGNLLKYSANPRDRIKVL